MYAQKQCTKSRHKVAKVLRLSVDNFENFLTARPDIKVIHLFRDPRAIINSRIETSWYPAKSEATVLQNAQALCARMKVDFAGGIKLLEKYPDRFRFLYYEDLNEEPMVKVRLLYKFLKMSLDPKTYPKVKSLPVFSSRNRDKSDRENNTAFWWRKTMQWDTVQKIDEICKPVYALLGYKTMTNETEMLDLSVPSLTIPDKYLLKNSIGQ